MGAVFTKILTKFLWAIAPSPYESNNNFISLLRLEKGAVSCQPDSLKEEITITTPIFGSQQTAGTISSHRTDIMYSNAVSRGRASRSNSFDSYDDEIHIPNLLPAPATSTSELESTDSFRVVHKKRPRQYRRGRRLNVAAADSNSDTATNSSRANSASPSHNKPHLRATTTTTTEISLDCASEISETPSREGKCIGSQSSLENHGEYQFDTTNPTPTQARYNDDLTSLHHQFDTFQFNTPSYKNKQQTAIIEIDPAEVSDTESTKGRTKEVMSQLTMALGGMSHSSMGKDAFDSVEWDPELPSADGADSPEPVPVKLQPVTYTTVGSLVDPNAKPQFSAPNRIQREGAVRQPLLSMISASQRPYDGFYQPRGPPPPPLNMANSMAYAQNIAKSPVHAPMMQNLTPPDTSIRANRANSAHAMSNLTDKEVEVLKRLQNSQTLGSNLNRSPSTPTPSSSTKLSAFAPSFEKKDQTLENTRGIGNNTVTADMARSLSSGAGISGLGGRSGSKAAADSSRNANIAASVSSFDNAFTKLVAATDRGNLDRTYTFPPPGLQSQQPNRQTNPLFGAYNPLASQQPNRGHPPGYPQPLTAGPPGQRQATVATTRTATNNLESLWNQSESSNSVYGGSAVQMQPLPMAADSPWQHGWQPQNIYTTGQSQLPAGIIAGAYPGPNRADPSAVKPMNDSLPPDAVAKYYPRGIPSDMTGHYRPLPEAKQKALDRVGHDAGRKIADSSRDFDDIFYSGQRRYATMKGEDFITELEDRQRANANPFGPIGPPKKIFPPGPALKKEITPEEMARMSIAEAAAPMIDAAFGSLLAYAEKGPESRKYLSGFVEAAPWQIDSTDKGNETMFGEDWGGRQPKRFGRDSRHQTRF